LAFEVNGQHIWAMHQDLETTMLTFVSKDVFVVVESLMESHCKDKSLELFHWHYFIVVIMCFVR
jgi:hypothetical protein